MDICETHCHVWIFWSFSHQALVRFFLGFPTAPNVLALQVKMATSLLPVVLAQYYVWPLAQFLSFRYCPASLRVLYCDIIGIVWNCFLCARLAAA